MQRLLCACTAILYYTTMDPDLIHRALVVLAYLGEKDQSHSVEWPIEQLKSNSKSIALLIERNCDKLEKYFSIISPASSMADRIETLQAKITHPQLAIQLPNEDATHSDFIRSTSGLASCRTGRPNTVMSTPEEWIVFFGQASAHHEKGVPHLDGKPDVSSMHAWAVALGGLANGRSPPMR